MSVEPYLCALMSTDLFVDGCVSILSCNTYSIRRIHLIFCTYITHDRSDICSGFGQNYDFLFLAKTICMYICNITQETLFKMHISWHVVVLIWWQTLNTPCYTLLSLPTGNKHLLNVFSYTAYIRAHCIGYSVLLWVYGIMTLHGMGFFFQ